MSVAAAPPSLSSFLPVDPNSRENGLPLLTFADAEDEPADHFRVPDLRLANPSSTGPPAAAALASTGAGKITHTQTPGSTTSTSSSTTTPVPPQQPAPPQTTRGRAAAASADANTALSDNPSSAPAPPQTRKPSPGLAARLKALGFGGSASATKPAAPPPPPSSSDRVGRLPEEQLRQLDQNHQAGSGATVIERRGRPWKGKGGLALPSLSGLKEAAAAAVAAATTTTKQQSPVSDPRPPSPAPSLCLPEIVRSEPLDMDTQKYRLPDHANGNGTKTQLDTRQEHIHRDTISPPSTADTASAVSFSSTAKDLPPVPTPSGPPAEGFDATSYFNPLGLQRAGSIYTLSRASFANQLAQLTSLQLPDAESLSGKVSAIPTAPAAARALINAADQIRGWVSKASEVIEGLDSDDDHEWAAAGGREGLEEVEAAVVRFEDLINVYISAIEELQTRKDFNEVNAEDLGRALSQTDSIMDDWIKIKRTLNDVKGQVEIAMEWEELWNNVLGDIQSEMDELIRLVFEVEERRHKSLMAVSSSDGVDIGDLETIVEETPPPVVRQQAAVAANRFSLPAFPASPSSPSPGAGGAPPPAAISQDDSTLVALFARMQPLRASLDFLPMRLSHFEARAKQSFPTACEELDMRREGLDANYRKLEKDAQSLQKELGEDRWVVVFRGAGRQAQGMYESVDKSLARLREAVDGGMHLTSPAVMAKRLENYENKKTHYGGAIERVLGIIDRGVKDRLTVNGEIVRLHAELQTKWEELKGRMRDMDAVLEEVQTDNKGQQLRDSISSMLSNDRSTVGSGNETPGSSPPSSVIMASLGFETRPAAATPKTGKSRSSSVGSHLPTPASARRNVSMPTPSSQVPRKPLSSRMSTLGIMPPSSREGSATPVGNRLPRPASTSFGRPKWNSSTNTSNVDTGHNFKPMSLTSPSPYATARSSSALGGSLLRESKLPLRSPLSRAGSSSPIPEDTPTRSVVGRPSFRDRLASPGPYAQQQQTVTKPRLATQSSMSALNNRRASLQPSRPNEKSAAPGTAAATGTATPARPASSLASSRRTSLLPQPRGPGAGTGMGTAGPATGRASPQAVAGARFAMRKGSSSGVGSEAKGKTEANNRPKWRG